MAVSHALRRGDSTGRNHRSVGLLLLACCLACSSCADAVPGVDDHVRCVCPSLVDACSCTEGQRVVPIATLRLDPPGTGASTEAFVTVGAPQTALGLAFEVVARDGGSPPLALSFDLIGEDGLVPGHDDLGHGAVRIGPLPAPGWLRLGELRGWSDPGVAVDVVVSAVVPATDPLFGHESWMDELDTTIASTALNALCIVGTHDSATSGINPESDWASDWPESQRALPASTAVRTSRAHDRSIALQLLHGARYLDLRFDVLESGAARAYHGLRAEHLESVLDEIRAFSEAHPRELLLLDFQHIVGEPAVADPTGDIVARVFGRLGDLAADPNALTPQSTVGEFWLAGTPIVVFFSGASATDQMNHPIWDRGATLSSLWGNQQEIGGLSTHLDQVVATRPTDMIFVLQAVLTPDDAMAVDWALSGQSATVVAPCPDDTIEVGLCSLARITNPAVLGWMSDPWGADSLNVVMVDHPEVAPLVEACVARNGDP